MAPALKFTSPRKDRKAVPSLASCDEEATPKIGCQTSHLPSPSSSGKKVRVVTPLALLNRLSSKKTANQESGSSSKRSSPDRSEGEASPKGGVFGIRRKTYDRLKDDKDSKERRFFGSSSTQAQPEDEISEVSSTTRNSSDYFLSRAELHTTLSSDEPVDSLLGILPRSNSYNSRDLGASETVTSTSVSSRNTASSSNHSASSSQSKSSFKIFLLLLHPKSKIFELIQLIFPPAQTTIGDILGMIPRNATEPSLGKQKYLGLCRPKEADEIMNMELVACSLDGENSARIKKGEILVAIPLEYTAKEVAALSEPILVNPRITKLIKTGSKTRRKHRTSSRGVQVLDKLSETDEDAGKSPMRKAMEKAVHKARAANAAVSPSVTASDFNFGDQHGSDIGNSFLNTTYGSDLISTLSASTSPKDKTLSSAADDSIDASYSSWSKSLDYSFAAKSVSSRGSLRAKRLRMLKKAERAKLFQRVLTGVFITMIFYYFLHPEGYWSSRDEEETAEHPLGFSGFLQFSCIYFLLFKMQLLFFSEAHGQKSERQCPFLASSVVAADTLNRGLKKIQL